MNSRRWMLVVVAVSLPMAARAADAPGELAVAARKVLKTHCAGCHVGDGSQNGYKFDALDVASMLKKHSDDQPPVLVPKSLDSRIWMRAGVDKNMPPRSVKARPTDAELDTLKKWIEAGAPAVTPPKPRPFISTYTQLKAIHDHLAAADPDDRPFLKFYTLAHLHNNPAVTDEDLRITRAALSKAVNSMSRMPRLALPKAIDKEETILVVNLKDYGWEKGQLWHAVLREYPYGLDYKGSEDDKLVKVQKDLDRLTRNELAYLRADWFVATATRPPLYYALLQLPDSAQELRKWLQVDLHANFRANKLWRGGLQASGVSGQNRLVERHDSPVGVYYWESYDFLPRRAKASLTRFPLGPDFPGNEHRRQAFQHDGGEMIFGLANRLQGYFLADGKGKRINAGPIDVVSDGLKTSGTPAIVNGMSCMHCHKHGMIGFVDSIRDGNAVFGDARDKVRALYPEKKVMDDLVKADEERFVAALEKTIGPFLQVGEDAKRPIREFGEPVGEVTRAYLLKDVSLDRAAAELGVEKPDALAGMIKGNPALKELGVLPLANGKTVKRDDWEAVDLTASLFQDVALALRLGTPIRHR